MAEWVVDHFGLGEARFGLTKSIHF